MPLILIFAATQSDAAQVLGVQVTHEGSRFLIGMHIAIDAAPADVFRALRDYAAMPRYNPDLLAVSVEPTSEPNRVRLFTTVHICVLLFCKTMHQEQVMTATVNVAGGVLQAELLPQEGAFQGTGHWAVKSCPENRPKSCVDAQIELVPNFWVPPVIGPWLIRKKMYDEAERSSVGLEQVALAAVSK